MDEESDTLLSTVDNPFNPWTEWDAWWTHDTLLGYHTLAYLARIVVSNDEMSEPDQARAYDVAVDEIISEHSDGFYIRVPKPQNYKPVYL